MKNNGRYSDISFRLRRVRMALGFSQVDFAKSIEISKQTYAHYESGDTCIPPIRARRLREIYGISLDFLYVGSLDTLPHKIAIALSSSPSDNISTKSKARPED